jgi:hypothetical protein
VLCLVSILPLVIIQWSPKVSIASARKGFNKYLAEVTCNFLGAWEFLAIGYCYWSLSFDFFALTS